MPMPQMSAQERQQHRWTVGDQLYSPGIPPISRTTLSLFAGASGDHNPVHLDIDLARQLGMDDVFAQGMLVMGYLGRLIADNFPLGLLRDFQARFTSITPVNAVLVCSGEVTAMQVDVMNVHLTAALADGTVTVDALATLALNGDH